MITNKSSARLSLLLCSCLCASASAQDKIARSQGILARKPVVDWIKQLNAHDSGSRKQAVIALGELGPEGESLVPLLVKRLKDKETSFQAVKSLQRIANGSYSSPAVDVLIDALKDRDQYSLADAILSALQTIHQLDEVNRQPRAGWFGVFPCAGNYGYATETKPSMISDDRKSYSQQFDVNWTGNREDSTSYKLAHGPELARLSGADLLLRQCPRLRERKLKSLDNVTELHTGTVSAWTWSSKDYGFSCTITKLKADTIWVQERLPADSMTGPLVVGSQDDSLAVAVKRRIEAAQFPPRTDFHRSLKEFEVLTKGTAPCDLELWAGYGKYHHEREVPGTSSILYEIQYDLPDTSRVVLTFKVSKPNPDRSDSQNREVQAIETGLVSVQHISKDQWDSDVIEEIPLN